MKRKIKWHGLKRRLIGGYDGENLWYEGREVIKVKLDDYCNKMTDEERLDEEKVYLIGNILHYQGYKIGELKGRREVVEWYPIETEYSFNNRKQRRIEC